MSLPMVPKAKYTARAIGSSFGIAESSNNYQVGIPFRIVEGEHANEEIIWFGHFTEKTEERTLESLTHLGWTGDMLTDLEALDEEGAAKMLPDLVEIVVEVEADRDGVDRLKVRWVNKIGGGRFAFAKPLQGADLKAFASQMRNKIRGAQQGGTKPATRPAAPAQRGLPAGTTRQEQHPNAPGFNDDIPF